MTNKIQSATWARSDVGTQDKLDLLLQLLKLNDTDFDGINHCGFECRNLTLDGDTIFYTNETPTHTLNETCLLFAPDWADRVIKIDDVFYWRGTQGRVESIGQKAGAGLVKTILTLDRNTPEIPNSSEWKPQVGGVCVCSGGRAEVLCVGVERAFVRLNGIEQSILISHLKPLPQKSTRDLAIEGLAECLESVWIDLSKEQVADAYKAGLRQVSREKLVSIYRERQAGIVGICTYIDALCERLGLEE